MAAGCVGSSAPVDGQIDFSITGPAVNSESTLHVQPDRSALLISMQSGTGTAILDASVFADLKAKIEAANFPTLDPVYRCTGICPAIASPTLHVAVEIANRSYSVEVESYYMTHTDRVPRRLVDAIGALQDIVDHTPWH